MPSQHISLRAGAAPVGKHVGDAGAHVDRRRRQPDRLGRQFHHRARISSASQLAGTSPGRLDVQPRSLRKLIDGYRCPVFRDTLRVKGMLQAANFSWSATIHKVQLTLDNV